VAAAGGAPIGSQLRLGQRVSIVDIDDDDCVILVEQSAGLGPVSLGRPTALRRGIRSSRTDACSAA